MMAEAQAKAQATLNELEHANNRAAEYSKTLTDLEHDRDIFDNLSQAFGRNGIIQYVIDGATSEFENIANELFEIATDGRMKVEFSTQKQLKSGDMAETLDIIVSNNGMSYDVSEYSGGEQKLIKTIIRLTLSLYMARREGNKLKALFVDEIMDDLDYANKDKMLLVIKHLSKYFDQIIVVSHDDDLIGKFENTLNLSK
jgi:exonuclease SbcC